MKEGLFTTEVAYLECSWGKIQLKKIQKLFQELEEFDPNEKKDKYSLEDLVKKFCYEKEKIEHKKYFPDRERDPNSSITVSNHFPKKDSEKVQEGFLLTLSLRGNVFDMADGSNIDDQKFLTPKDVKVLKDKIKESSFVYILGNHIVLSKEVKAIGTTMLSLYLSWIIKELLGDGFRVVLRTEEPSIVTKKMIQDKYHISHIELYDLSLEAINKHNKENGKYKELVKKGDGFLEGLTSHDELAKLGLIPKIVLETSPNAKSTEQQLAYLNLFNRVISYYDKIVGKDSYAVFVYPRGGNRNNAKKLDKAEFKEKKHITLPFNPSNVLDENNLQHLAGRSNAYLNKHLELE